MLFGFIHLLAPRGLLKNSAATSELKSSDVAARAGWKAVFWISLWRSECAWVSLVRSEASTPY